MKTTHFEAGNCKEVRPYLDSYLNNELLVETNHEMLKHLERCAECTRLADDRARVKAHLKRAVLSEQAPDALLDRIRTDIRRTRRSNFKFNMPLVLAATAAVLVVAVGVFLFGSNDTNSRLAQLSINAEVAPKDVAGQILKLGFDDHVFCAIDHDMANRRFTPEQMREKLGPQYEGLLLVVKETMPADYDVVVGHRCYYQRREFVHLILRQGNELLSLIVTQKSGEAFPSGAAPAEAPVYESVWHNLHVTGTETRDHLVFLVSNMPKGDAEQVSSTLAAAVSGFLKKEEA